MTQCCEGDVPDRHLRYKNWSKYCLLTLIWVAFWTKRFVLIGRRLKHTGIKWIIHLMYNMVKELLSKPLVACKFKCHDLVSFHKFHNACMNCKIWIICFFYNAGIAVLLLPSIWAMDYKYQMMDLMPDYSAKDMLLFYGNTKKRKLKSRTQSTLKIYDDQSWIL